ncbi:MAG: hypothetical protein HOO91_19905 [Bacteroidales bacterium]|nr:hypothetical protein [Bacteroidales bacterium]
MEKFIKFAFALIVLSSTVFYVFGQTLKERIELAKEVKVYFKYDNIGHNPNTIPQVGSNLPSTNCESFSETTPLPIEYTNAVNGLLELLNKDFNTTAFVAGDFSKVPVRTSVSLKKEPDWVALGKPLKNFVSTWGEYVVDMTPTGKQNSKAIQSYLTIYYLKDGKIEMYDQIMLSYKHTEPINTQKCDDYACFVQNFPAKSLAEPFKTSLIENTNELIDKDMKAYEKAMIKKK